MHLSNQCKHSHVVFIPNKNMILQGEFISPGIRRVENQDGVLIPITCALCKKRAPNLPSEGGSLTTALAIYPSFINTETASCSSSVEASLSLDSELTMASSLESTNDGNRSPSPAPSNASFVTISEPNRHTAGSPAPLPNYAPNIINLDLGWEINLLQSNFELFNANQLPFVRLKASVIAINKLLASKEANKKLELWQQIRFRTLLKRITSRQSFSELDKLVKLCDIHKIFEDAGRR